VLLPFLGPSGNALPQSFERNFHIVILKMPAQKPAFSPSSIAAYYPTPLRATTIIGCIGGSGKK